MAKPAKELKIGDVITISFLDRKQSFKVLAFPSAKNTPKSEQAKYAQEL